MHLCGLKYSLCSIEGISQREELNKKHQCKRIGPEVAEALEATAKFEEDINKLGK